MGKWAHIFESGSNNNIREIDPLELLGPVCDRCTNATATESAGGDQLCSSCAAWVRERIASGDFH